MSGGALGLSTGRVLRNTVARSAASVLNVIAGAGTGLLVARHLGPQGYGSFSFVWAIAWTAVAVVPLGFDTLLVRELNRRPRLLDLRRAMPAVAMTGVVVAAGLVIAGFAFASRQSLALALTAAALYVVASGPLALVRAVFDARERMGLTAATEILRAVGTLVVVALMVVAGAGLVAISVAVSAATAVTLAVAVAVLRRLPEDPASDDPRRPLPRLLRASLPMAGSRLASELLKRLDVVLLGLFVAPREMGWYVAAATVAIYAPVALMELNRALYPVLSRAESAEDHDLLRLFGFTWRAQLLLGCVAAAGLAVLAQPVVVLLYGGDYLPAGPLLAVLAATVPLRVMSALCAVTLDATYRQLRRLRASGVALTVNLVANLSLIPIIGVWGAAIATVVTELVFLVVVVRALRPHRPRVLAPLGWSLLAAAPVAAVAAVTPGPSYVRLAAGFLTFCGIAAWVLWRRWGSAEDGEYDLRAIVQSVVASRREGRT